jgi:molecular chaperone HscB
MQYYEALGLEPKLALDPEDLEKRFNERSRPWHPDLFSHASVEERQRGLDMTALLNDACRTLRDPMTRAEYFLQESGIEPFKIAHPKFMAKFSELNTMLEKLRAGDESVRLPLLKAQRKYSNQCAEMEADLVSCFEKADQSVPALRPAALDAIGMVLSVKRYFSNFLRDVEKELNVHAAN